MGNAGSMDQHTDFRGHNMPLKLPMPEPGELEERFATVLVRKMLFFSSFICLLFVPSMLQCPGTGQLCVGWTPVCPARLSFVAQRKKGLFLQELVQDICICCTALNIFLCLFNPYHSSDEAVCSY